MWKLFPSNRFVCALSLTFAMFGQVSTRGAEPPRPVALLIGVNDYERTGFSNLAYAREDVESLARLLRSHGYDVTVLTNGKADKESVLNKVKTIRGRREKEAPFLLGFSGHGVETFNKNDITDAFLCPAGCDKFDTDTMISISDLVRLMGSSGSNLLLIDACRSDPKRGEKGPTGGSYLRDPLPVNTAILFSCDKGQSSWETTKMYGNDSAKGHGVFFYHVLDALSGTEYAGGRVSWFDLVKHVTYHVNEKAKTWLAEQAQRDAKRLQVKLAELKFQTPAAMSHFTNSPLLIDRSGDQIDRYLDSVAAELTLFLRSNNQTTIVPKFLGLSSFPAGIDHGFVQKLQSKLVARGLNVSQRGRYAVVMKFSIPPESKKKGLLRLRLQGTIEEDGNLVHTLLARGPNPDMDMLTDPKAIAEYLGLPSTFRPAHEEEKGQKDLDRAFRKGLSWVSANKLQVGVANRREYTLEVKVGDKSRPFRLGHAGLAFAKLNEGEEYTIILHNHSDYECAVELKVDGLSIFHFSDEEHRILHGPRVGESKYRYYFVPANGSTKIDGWFKNHEDATKFKITDLANAAVKRAGVGTGSTGLVTATFYATWVKDELRPDDEPSKEVAKTERVLIPIRRIVVHVQLIRKQGKVFERAFPWTAETMQAVMSTRLATGFGREVRSSSRGVKQTIGVPRATIAFRYTRPIPKPKPKVAGPMVP